METKRFKAKIEQLPNMLHWIHARLSRSGVEKGQIHKIELAVEEALVNIINYAYAGGRGEIDLECESAHPNFVLNIRDWGVPFNPLENISAINRYTPLEDRRIGGLGIAIIYNLMDEVRYAREGKSNLLTLVRHL